MVLFFISIAFMDFFFFFVQPSVPQASHQMKAHLTQPSHSVLSAEEPTMDAVLTRLA